MSTIKHHCGKCGADVFNKAPYCSNCGTRLIYPEETQTQKVTEKITTHKKSTLEFFVFLLISGVLLYNGYRESGFNISYLLEGYFHKELIIDLILILIPPITLMSIYFKSIKWFLGTCFLFIIALAIWILLTHPQ